MHQAASIKKIIAFAFLMAFLNAKDHDNVIINRVTISPNSEVKGNVGIIIGDKVIKGSNLQTKKLLASQQKAIPCFLKTLAIQTEDCEIVIQKKPKCTIKYPKFIEVNSTKHQLTISDPQSLGIPTNIDISIHKIENITIDGSNTIVINMPMPKLKITVIKDNEIKIQAPLQYLEINYEGDLILQIASHLQSLKVKGKGDVTIIAKSKPKIIKDIDGDIDFIEERE